MTLCRYVNNYIPIALWISEVNKENEGNAQIEYIVPNNLAAQSTEDMVTYGVPDGRVREQFCTALRQRTLWETFSISRKFQGVRHFPHHFVDLVTTMMVMVILMTLVLVKETWPLKCCNKRRARLFNVLSIN